MHEKLKEMMAKKRDLSPSEKKAKMDAVHEMRGVASEMMGDKMDGLKKVSIMANSKQGLAHGLDKAKEIISQGQQDQMSSDSEAPYSDAKHAMQEHSGEQQSDEFGNMPGMADGGPVLPGAESAQESMRNAFGHSEGGEIESPDYESEGGYSDREESDDSEDGSPADQEASDEGDSDGEEMSSEELDAQLAKLMKMKKKMESK